MQRVKVAVGECVCAKSSCPWTGQLANHQFGRTQPTNLHPEAGEGDFYRKFTTRAYVRLLTVTTTGEEDFGVL